MAVPGKQISAASTRAHTRNKMNSNSPALLLPQGMLKSLSIVILVGLLALAYKAIQPTPPSICGSPNGPPVTASRVKLSDGRHLAYKESGVPKERAKHKIVFIHGFDSCRHDVLQVSQELAEELSIYILSFDRAGYGESDPNPKRTEKSTALDVQELADQLGVGTKFYVIGFSMGGEITWTCLKYIPERLAGAALLGPVANFWWRGFPSNVTKAAYKQQLPRDQLAVGVTHYAPWLTYWWNTQRYFPSSSVIALTLEIFSAEDRKVLPKFAAREPYRAQIRQQGDFESLHRDMMVGFGTWEFSPLELENPFRNGGQGSVHLWHGAQDWIVPVGMSRYISQKLPWLHYHELPEAGHMFPLADGMPDTIVRQLLLGAAD